MLSEDAACLNSSAEMDMVDDELTDDHMRLLAWLDAHPTGSLAAAAQALGLAITEVEGLSRVIWRTCAPQSGAP